MKKQLLFILMMLMPMVANAYTGEVVIGDVKYNISTKAGTAEAIGLGNPNFSGALVIPGSIEFEGTTCYVSSVTGFSDCNGITSLTIGEGITTLQVDCFRDCSNLAEINLPQSLSFIEGEVFAGTAWYNNSPDGLLYLGDIAYKYKGDMQKDTEISIKEGTRIISSKCFRNMANLKGISFPASLKSILGMAFYGCTSLKSLSLHNLKIGRMAFSRCENLKDVTIDNIVCIDNYGNEGLLDIFNNSNNIEKVTINCKSVKAWFGGKPLLKDIILSDNVEEICLGAFSGAGIETITIPNSVKYLSGFDNCTKLDSFNIPSSVKTIGRKAFKNCTGIKEFNLPFGLKKIEGYAFEGCTGITNIELPSSIDSIGYDDYTYSGSTFGGCTNLKTVTLHEGIKAIAEYSFRECNLYEIKLPEGLSVISECLFGYCKNLHIVQIPSSVIRIVGGAFSYCPEITDVYCYAPVLPEIQRGQYTLPDPFDGSEIQYATLHVPAEAIESYKVAEYWKDFKEIVAIEDYEAKKCATPRIKYESGKISFSCDTEGAKFLSKIMDTDIRNYDSNTINLSVAYQIKVYATAPDHVSSDTARATLCWIDSAPKMDIGNNTQYEIVGSPILIQSNDGAINIQGVKAGTPVSVYDLSGVLRNSVVSKGDDVTLKTKQKKGETTIVHIGDKTIKFLMQ